jgi:hypothetical protein
MLLEMTYKQPACANDEELGQRQGVLVSKSSAGRNLAVITGQLLIKLGEKLTANGTTPIQLSEKPA